MHDHDDGPLPLPQYSDKLGIYLISPSGALAEPERLVLAQQRLSDYGFSTVVDRAATGREQRFAASDQERAHAFSRAALSDAPVVMATRGGYGLTRILPLIDWELLAKHPKRYVGYSDFTAFNLALLAKTGLSSYSGPNAMGDFAADTLDDFNAACFTEVMRDELEVISVLLGDYQHKAQEIDFFGTLWGGNLTVLCSLLGTPYFPDVNNGILFLEDVNESPYRIERHLTQLYNAGVLQRQQAILLGDFSHYQLSPADYGYDLPQVWDWLASRTGLPIVSGLPYGHDQRRLTLPIGRTVGVAVDDGLLHIVLESHHHDCEDPCCTFQHVE